MLTNDQEKTHYLANILVVAFADKSVSAREAAALEVIRKSIDAKKSLLTTARKAVETGSVTLVKVGSFADQVKNLEDMLFVGLTDGDLTESEAHTVREFSQLIGVNDGQFEQLTTETSLRCDAANHEIACPGCSEVTSAQARFCPSCGQPFTSTGDAATQIAFEIPKTGYAIEFCESTAAGFATALELGKATGSLQTATKNKKVWYMVAFRTENFADMVPLASSLSGMRNKRVYFEGQERPWDEIFGFIWCASQRATAYRPIEYCFGKDDNQINPWGCKQARMDWTDWAPWFSYGHWQKVGLLRSGYVFVFDKERIRHELGANLFRHRFCPYMRTQLPEAVIRHLPDQVEVTPEADWKYNRGYDESPGAIKVIEREGSGAFVYSTEYHSDGVRPKGYAALGRILKRAFDDCRITDLEAVTLLSK